MGRPRSLSTPIGPDFAANVLTPEAPKAIYRRYGTPSASRCDGAPSKHLTDSGDQTSDFGRVFWASAALRYSGEGDRTVPGLFDK